MKKRIFAIICIVVTLSLFAFPTFAAAVNHDDMIKEKVYSYSNTDGIYFSSTSLLVETVTLEEGLYFVSVNLKYCEYELNDVGLYFKNFANTSASRVIYSATFWADYIDRFYIYVTAPIDIVFHCTSGTSALQYAHINIWSTKSYDEIRNDGYITGKNDGWYEGYAVGKKDGETTGYDNAIEAAREQVYNTAYNTGYYQGDIDGYDRGYYNGYTTGKNDGLEEGYDDGLEEGYDDGYTEGRFCGLEEGYENGYGTGYGEGRKIAQHAAYAQGKEDGFNEAIQDSEEVKTAIGGIFTGIFDGCVDSFNELTEGITLMGLTLKQILLTIAALGIIGVCIWLFALKK